MNLAIADDHAVVREGIRWMLESQRDVNVVAEVDNGRALLELFATDPDIDVVLLDLRMPDLNGFEVLDRLRDLAPGVRAVVMTMHDEPAYVRRALELGASGYLLKNADRIELMQALHAAVGGQTYVQGTLTGSLVRGLVAATSSRQVLSPREQEVLQHVADGLENKQVAKEMSLSEATVKSYLKNVFTRLEVGSRAEAVAVALRLGLIE